MTAPIGPLATARPPHLIPNVHLQLARALKFVGDRDRAKANYSAFLTLWKDADADLPVLPDAKSEFAAIPNEAHVVDGPTLR